MIVSAYQPYFAPFTGFFAKALMSDVFVIMDAVQFPQRSSWLTRNRFKNDQGTLWLRVPVWRTGKGLQKINEVRVCHEGLWKQKALSSLKTAYANAPFFEDHAGFLERVFSKEIESLVDLNLMIIQYLAERFEVRARVVLLSDLGIEAVEPRLSVEIGKKLGASHFLAQKSAAKYLDREAFDGAGVSLRFFNPRPAVYPQLWGQFIPNLSSFDLLFNCGPKAARFLKKCAGRQG